MKVLSDLLPILVFFLLYKIAGIYAATAAAIIAAVGQWLFYKIVYHRVEPMVTVTAILILVLGGATLLFHNDAFIKWKPTAIDWAFAGAFLGSHFSAKTLMQRMLETQIQLAAKIWQQLNFSWCLFFLLMGGANLYVAFHYSTDTWVNFKVFGSLGLTVAFVIAQSVYINRHVSHSS